MSKRVSEQFSALGHVSEASSAEQVNERAVRAVQVVRPNGRVSGPELTSEFLVVHDHSELVKIGSKRMEVD